MTVGTDSVEHDPGEDLTGKPGSVDLYWIPLGAGAHVVRLSGKVFEATSALLQRRRPRDLYHSALQVVTAEGRFVIEMTPVADVHGEHRGVVAEGPVGTRWARRLRLFRYEIRRWRGGVIPDVYEAISSPVRVITDLGVARNLLDLVPSVPTLVWGRDELDAGDMWNSNSVTSWLLTSIGLETREIRAPEGGRAPGWDAGRVAATGIRDPGKKHGNRPAVALHGRPGRPSENAVPPLSLPA